MKSIAVVALTLLVCVQAKGQSGKDDPAEIPPGWWKIPKTATRMKVGGYVKFDLIHDFNPIGSPDYFDVSTIPTDGSKGENTHMHAKETRAFVDFRSPSKVGELRAYVEGDFYGTNGAFRLRHVFVEINNGKWLAGQWWSNFMDENIIPPTLDFEKPAAYAFARHAMLRWKHALSSDAYFAIAVEEPSTRAQTPAESGKFESPLPDLTARYRITKEWGHLQLSGFVAQLRYRFIAGGTDNVSLFGGNLSGQLNFLANDKFIYQIVYGPGVGRFRGGLGAGLDGNGDLEPISDIGVTAGIQHFWSDNLSSLMVYNQGSNDTTEGQPQTDVSRINYMALNLVWHFADNAFVGIEYSRGTREDINEEYGTANRIQFSVKYSFN